jgi:protein SCO1/2
MSATGSPARIRIVMPLALALVVIAGASAAAMLLRGGPDESVRFRGNSPPAGIALPAFALPDFKGELVRTQDLHGKAVLVTFLDTQCSESCPIIAAVIGRALERLSATERAEVAAIAISTDPAEDTPEAVSAFLRDHKVEDELRYLVSSVGELRPVWQAFQIASSFDTGEDDLHSAPVRIFDRSGEWVATLHAGVDLTSANLAHDLAVVLNESDE